MRVLDAEVSVSEGLRGLDWRRYLCAMWILCGELRELYADRLTGAERSLMASALDAVREVTMAGEVTADVARKAAGLYQPWKVMITEREDEFEVMAGHLNTWLVFRDLVFELTEAGRQYPYLAADRLTLAATDRWRESQELQPGPIIENPRAEVVDDSSPMARTLSLFGRVVTGVTEMRETEMREAQWDPVKVRVHLLG
jgi:hypothetical protein